MLKSFKHVVKSEVDFDVTNPQHRAWAGEFLRRDSWQHCPIRFRVPPGYGNLVNMMENQLTCWYLAQEFRNVIPTRGEKWATELSQQTRAIKQGLA
jgi:hypothetical protein